MLSMSSLRSTSRFSESESESGSDSTAGNSKDSSRSRNTYSSTNEDVVSQRRKGHHTNWNVRMGKRESGSGEVSDADMGTDSDVEEDDEEDEEE